MSKTFTIILGIASLLGISTKTAGQGAHLIGFILGGIIAGIAFGIFFDWIWAKTKSKFVKIILVIFSIIFVGGKLGNLLSFVNKISLENSYSKNFQSQPNKASSYLNAIFSSLEPSFKEAKKINLRQALDKAEKQLNKENITTLTYFEELETLQDLQQKIGPWINDFDKKDVERFYNFFDNIFLTLKTAYKDSYDKDSSELLKQICVSELANNSMRSLAHSAEQVEILKKLMELGVEKFITYAMDKYPTPEERKRFIKTLSNNNTLNYLQKLVNTKLFIPIAEELIKEIAQMLQSADKTEINFDLKKYMETKFTRLKDSPEGQKEIIQDIQELKEKLSLLIDAAVMEAYFK